jgi:hypothetical protein
MMTDVYGNVYLTCGDRVEGPLTLKEYEDGEEWKHFFNVIFELEDNAKQAQRDTERVNAAINALQKRNIPIEKKRRKGRILKELRRNMRGWSKSTCYSVFAIRCAICEINNQDWGVYA